MRCHLLSVLCLYFTLAGLATADDAKEVKLFNGKDLSGWEHFLVKDEVKMEDVWSVEDGILVCKGDPGGYLATKKKYESFKLVVEWRWPDKPGNSGVLMRITGKPMMLPYCFEAQLKSGDAGALYGFQGFKFDGDKARKFENANAVGGLTGLRKIDGAENEPGEWNKYEITVKGGDVTIVVNGKKVNEANDCEVRPGQIGLQSEGGVIHFRTVTLTPLKSE